MKTDIQEGGCHPSDSPLILLSFPSLGSMMRRAQESAREKKPQKACEKCATKSASQWQPYLKRSQATFDSQKATLARSDTPDSVN